MEFVQSAINRYERDGRDATIAYYNTRESVDGQWYVFIIGENDRTIGHYNPPIRNRDPAARVDVTGYYYGPDILGTDEEGRWVTYVFLNPRTNQQELKARLGRQARRPDIRLRLVRALHHHAAGQVRPGGLHRRPRPRRR